MFGKLAIRYKREAKQLEVMNLNNDRLIDHQQRLIHERDIEIKSFDRKLGTKEKALVIAKTENSRLQHEIKSLQRKLGRRS